MQSPVKGQAPIIGGGAGRGRAAKQRDRDCSGAFTLVELMVVTATLAILAALLLPALTKATGKAQGIQCLSNTRQMTLAWLLYADDNEGRLAPNQKDSLDSWISGVLSFGSDNDNTNIQKLLDPHWAKFGPYLPAARSYKCSSDRSRARFGEAIFPRVRSYAMNSAIGMNTQPAMPPFGSGWRVYRKMTDIVAPAPSRLWLLMDEHPDSIDDCAFVVDCENQGVRARLISFPAYFHDGASSLAFADGHAETHRWVDERTKHEIKYCGCISSYVAQGYFADTPNNPDVAWLQERTSSKTPLASLR